MNDVTLTIDRIVMTDLDLSPRDAERTRALIEAELTELIARQGLPGGMTPDRVDAGRRAALELSRGMNERQLANAVARRIVEALHGPS